MAGEQLRQQTLEQVLDQVQALASVASKPQVQSVMAVLVRCTMELSESLAAAAGEIKSATSELGRTRAEICAFNKSTTELTNRVIRLNRILTWATVVIAIGTVVVAFTAIFGPG
jgi:hypothetical protein